MKIVYNPFKGGWSYEALKTKQIIFSFLAEFGTIFKWL